MKMKSFASSGYNEYDFIDMIEFIINIQSNQKMYDLYATKHISEMVFPGAFGGSIESNVSLISYEN